MTKQCDSRRAYADCRGLPLSLQHSTDGLISPALRSSKQYVHIFKIIIDALYKIIKKKL